MIKVTERLTQAEESMKEVEFLYREKIGNKIVFTKLYHTMIYCLFALFEIKDIGNLTHADLIENFEKEYVQKGVFKSKFLSVIRNAYNLTHECDCEHMPVPDDEDVQKTMIFAKEFLTEVESYLQIDK